MAVDINDFTAVLLNQIRLLKEPAIVVVWHKTNFIALRFLSQFRIAKIFSHFTNFSLSITSQGKQSSAKKVLLQSP